MRAPARRRRPAPQQPHPAGIGRGFTLIEMVVVIAIVAVLAAAAIFGMRAARRNASVHGSAMELALRLEGMRLRAMRDQRELLAVLVDVGDVGQCARGDDRQCAMFHLLRPQPGFALNAFNPAMPFVAAQAVDRETLPDGIRFHRAADGRPAPRPFDAIRVFDPELLGNCGGRSCVGLRFRGDGTVAAEYPGGVAGNPKIGLALALGSELTAETRGTDQRGILVTFPTGIVKPFPLSQ